MSKLFIIVLAILAVLVLTACSGEQETTSSSSVVTTTTTTTTTTKPEPTAATEPTAQPDSMGENMSMQYDSPPATVINETKTYKAVINTTLGAINVDLFTTEVPNTVNNFVFLAREGFYDNVIFHRVIPGFMIQGGDPTGTGMGGPGYRFNDEPVRRQYDPGILAMANSGPNTNGSQFFIMHGAVALPPNYTIFGFATGGLDVVHAIASSPTAPGGEGSRPIEPPQILSIEIIEEG